MRNRQIYADMLDQKIGHTDKQKPVSQGCLQQQYALSATSRSTIMPPAAANSPNAFFQSSGVGLYNLCAPSSISPDMHGVMLGGGL